MHSCILWPTSESTTQERSAQAVQGVQAEVTPDDTERHSVRTGLE